MKELVSIIVPVYNVEKYLKRCISSLLDQTYKKIEILLINDGSTDNSEMICKRYEKLDSRIKLYNKKNGGLSSARNYGIQKSKGDYIIFIDSDDYISNTIIEKSLNRMKIDNSDICCFAKQYIYSNRSKVVNNKNDFCVDGITALQNMLLSNDIDNSACDKLFKKDLFNEIEFPINMYYEDIGTVYKLFLKSNKVSHIREIGYYYVIRDDSITTEKFSDKQFDCVRLSKKQMDDINSISDNLREECEAFYYLSLVTIIIKYNTSYNKNEYKNEIKKIYKEYNNIFFELLKNKYIPFYKKIMCFFIRIKLYKFVIYIRKLRK